MLVYQRVIQHSHGFLAMEIMGKSDLQMGFFVYGKLFNCSLASAKILFRHQKEWIWGVHMA